MKTPASRIILPYLLILWLPACSQPLPEEKQLALTLERMEQAADNKQLTELMAYFHASFLGRKNMRKQELQSRVYFHFRTNPKVRVYLSNIVIKVEGADAEVSCHLLVTGSQQQIPDRGRLYRISSSWKKFADKWLVVAADWEDQLQELVN